MDPNEFARILASPNLVPSQIRNPIQQHARLRGNGPPNVNDDIATPEQPLSKDILWIVDRILEPQTLPHFLESISEKRLPGGKESNIPSLDVDEVMKMAQPFSLWAPPPFNSDNMSTMDHCMVRIGSYEDSTNLMCISKTLHSMKGRLWEAIMPLSNREWKDRRLHEPSNFSEACQFMNSVIKVFKYLNRPDIKLALQTTYNNIWNHIETFEEALNAFRRVKGKDTISVVALWTEYVRAHFDLITSRSHAWVIDHIERFREPILQQIQNHTPTDLTGNYDDRQWELTNMLHDLLEISSHADWAIILSMDGYKGVGDANQPYRSDVDPTQPLPAASPLMDQRRQAYHNRMRYLSRSSVINDMLSNPATLFSRAPMNNPEEVLKGCRAHIREQAVVRAELRGATVATDSEHWVREATRQALPPNESLKWGFVVYRASHGHSDEEWVEFKAKFEADLANWGDGVHGDLAVIKARCALRWLDAKDLGISSGSLEQIKRHFISFIDSESAPSNVWKDVFLVADEACMSSYLSPSWQQGGFIQAVDVHFDPDDRDHDRSEESPGYDGTLRIQGSLLWHDVSAMLLMQTQFLDDMWPLAMDHPLGVYTGPVVPAMKARWKTIKEARKSMCAAWSKWEEPQH